MRIHVAVLATLTLGAATPNHDADFVMRAKAMASRDMKDPLSVQFRNIHVIPGSQKGRRVCGEINAKNSYGGYVGFTPFAYESAFDDVIVYDSSHYNSMWDIYSDGC